MTLVYSNQFCRECFEDMNQLDPQEFFYQSGICHSCWKALESFDETLEEMMV